MQAIDKPQWLNKQLINVWRVNQQKGLHAVVFGQLWTETVAVTPKMKGKHRDFSFPLDLRRPHKAALEDTCFLFVRRKYGIIQSPKILIWLMRPFRGTYLHASMSVLLDMITLRNFKFPKTRACAERIPWFGEAQYALIIAMKMGLQTVESIYSLGLTLPSFYQIFRYIWLIEQSPFSVLNLCFSV